MGKVIHLNTLDPYLEKLKKSGGMWRIDRNKYAIKHLEVERLATLYNIETDISVVHCDLKAACAVVKAGASFQGKKYYSLGEVSPQNNRFGYPVAMAEKRAVDRAVLKALGIHGEVYSDVELDNRIEEQRNENEGVDINQASIILERLKNIRHIANLEELKSDNKMYLGQLEKQNLELCKKVIKAISDKQLELKGVI